MVKAGTVDLGLAIYVAVEDEIIPGFWPWVVEKAAVASCHEQSEKAESGSHISLEQEGEQGATQIMNNGIQNEQSGI